MDFQDWYLSFAAKRAQKSDFLCRRLFSAGIIFNHKEHKLIHPEFNNRCLVTLSGPVRSKARFC